MTIRGTYNSSVASNHASAEVGGIAFNTGATVTPINSVMSRAQARIALANGGRTQNQYVYLMQQISGWEQAQNNLAKATLRNGGDYFPV